MMRRQRSCALAFVLVAASLQLILADTALFCVHNEDERSECRRLRSIPPLNADCSSEDAKDCLEFACVIAADCRVEIRESRADIMMASALGLWYLEQDYPTDSEKAYAPVVAENRGLNSLDTRQDGLTYKAIAIATQEKCNEMEQRGKALTITNSKGLRSDHKEMFMQCHGEYGDLAGWVAPIARMKTLKLSEGSTDIDMVTSWFDQSCAPSNSDDGLCSACADDYACDLDDPYATSLGVISCLREDAADIGFVDHWTALGAGQPVSDDGGDVDMSDLQVVCNGGCKDLTEAIEANCYLAKVPSDVAIMRATDTRIDIVRSKLVQASNEPQFAATFGTSSNLNGALFSHGTSNLGAVTDSTRDYLGGLDGTLTKFSDLFKDSTDMPQPDVGDSRLVREVKAHPGWAVGITFIGALFLGMLVGLGLMTVLCRRRMRAARHQAQYPDKDMMDAPEAAIHRGGPAIHRGGPVASMDIDNPTYVDES